MTAKFDFCVLLFLSIITEIYSKVFQRNGKVRFLCFTISLNHYRIVWWSLRETAMLVFYYFSHYKIVVNRKWVCYQNPTNPTNTRLILLYKKETTLLERRLSLKREKDLIRTTVFIFNTLTAKFDFCVLLISLNHYRIVWEKRQGSIFVFYLFL